MRIIVIILVLIAVGFYAKSILPPEYYENLTKKFVTAEQEAKPEVNRQQGDQLRDVPESQLNLIKQVFSPELLTEKSK